MNYEMKITKIVKVEEGFDKMKYKEYPTSKTNRLETFDLVGISMQEMFYLLEKSYESIQRWKERYEGPGGEHPKNHPLYNFLKQYSDKGTVPFGPIDEAICNLVTEIEHLN